MSRPRAADDFEAIRQRMRELRGESAPQPAVDTVAEAVPQARPIREPDAVAHVPGHVLKRFLAQARRSSVR